MAKKNRLTLDFDGFDELLNNLKAVEGNVKETTEDALKKSRSFIAENLHNAMEPHTAKSKRNKHTEDAIRDDTPVTWIGTRAEIPVGFDIKNGGLVSVFLMYGTKLHGTQHIKPDKKLYNAIYGKATKNKVAEIQRKAFDKAIQDAMKGN